ncbi:MAG TPA: dephospho-CoA kinase [Anaeromyxobacter sp.]|nr:dephospho-CoA kinase [Anaeromyxobacter sp.]
MRVVGLTGGIASGKSTFAARLRERGVPVVDADALARQVVEPGAPALAEVAQVFGPSVLLPGGRLDRRRMGALVFADPAARRRLEAITHPAIRAAMAEEVRRLSALGHLLAFYDVPLLFEAGLEAELDAVVVIWAPREVQLERLSRRDRLAPAEAEARLAAQLSLEEKAARADFVVANDGPPEALGDKADRLLGDLRRGLGRRLPNDPPVRY